MIETVGRSAYRKCDVVYWEKPVQETCPKWGTPFMLEKTTKRDGTVRYCQNEECDYKMAIDTENLSSESRSEDTVRA